MSTKPHKVQLTVRLQSEAYRAAKVAQRRSGMPLAVIVADAATKNLLPSQDESAEIKIQTLSNRLLSRMETLERSIGRELYMTKELLAQFARAYFNHTPAIPESERNPASTSGRLRFVRVVEQVKVNVLQGVSILNETETPDV
jgi:hypothetical protein